MNLLKILEAYSHIALWKHCTDSMGLVMCEKAYHCTIPSSILRIDFYKYLLI